MSDRKKAAAFDFEPETRQSRQRQQKPEYLVWWVVLSSAICTGIVVAALIIGVAARAYIQWSFSDAMSDKQTEVRR